jgi:hypothetical protein
MYICMFFICHDALSYDKVSWSLAILSDPQCRNLAPAQEHVDRSASAPLDCTPETMCQPPMKPCFLGCLMILMLG